MTFRDRLAAIKMAPEAWLTEPCVIALGAFLFGYKAADPSVGLMLANCAVRIGDKPSAGDAATRAYLSSCNTIVALKRVLDELLAASDYSTDSGATIETRSVRMHVVDSVRESIVSGRTGVVLAEPSITWFANYARGNTEGLKAVGAALGHEQEDSFLKFERWLQSYYGYSEARWYSLLRIFGGPGIFGLREFIVQWDQWRRNADDPSLKE